MAEAGNPKRPEAHTQPRDTFEALARTLRLEALRLEAVRLEVEDLPLGATLRRGTLLVPVSARGSDAPIPETRGAEEAPKTVRLTLPRLELASPTDPSSTADLELVRPLGEGGMGVVWLARQHALSREVAVKRLKVSEHASAVSGAGTVSSSNAGALLREARATGALEHPSVVPVHALGQSADGSPLLVMKRIEGESLEALIQTPAHEAWPALLRRHGDRTAAIVEILSRVADALELAHERGIVHRDVKPENVMVGRYGEVYLVDWGIALRPAMLEEEDGAGIVGTPSFMAPEMVQGDVRAIDAQTDVYLLGATLHAALTGTPRHPGRTLSKVLLAALSSEPVTYDAEHAELGALANRATRPDKRERPKSAAAFREALTDFVRHRASSRLAEEARGRLEGLGHEGAPTPAVLASPEATRILTESRFAFTQALREWEGNSEARRGLGQTLRWMIEAELHRRSPDAAEALLSALGTGEPAAAETSATADLSARIAALRSELQEARRLEDQARAEAREQDPRRTARQRAWISAGLILLTVVLVVLGWRSELSHAGVRSMAEALTYDAVLLGFVGALVIVFRRRLFSNRRGRQTTAALGMVLAFACVSDGLSFVRGAGPRDAGAFAMLAMAGVIGGAGIGVDARFLWSSAAFLVGAIVAGFFPALTIPAIGSAAIAATSVVLVDALLQLRAPDPPR
jgi:hypothetical protein